MRNLKKMLAAIVAVAMMLSMVAVTSFAEDSQSLTLRVVAEKSSLKTNQETTLSIYVDKAETTTESFSALTYSFSYDSKKLKVTAVEDVLNGDVTPQYPIGDEEAPDGAGLIAAGAISGANNVDLTKPIQVVKVKAIGTAEKDVVPVVVTMTENSIKSTRAQGNYKYTVTSEGVTISIVPSFTATKVDALSGVKVELGTDIEDVKKELPAKATVRSADDAKFEELPVGDWTSADYNAAVPGTYTFTASITATEDDAATLADTAKTATVEVTVDPLTTITKSNVPVSISVEPKEVDGKPAAYDEAALKAAVVAAISEVKVQNGEFNDVYTITDANVAVKADGNNAATNDGDVTKMTITLNGASKNGLFDLTDVVIDTEVKVEEVGSYIPPAGLPGATGTTGGTGLPTTKPEDKEDPADKPGTEEPGTEEPGTDEPGTEEPGTEEPGTDAPVAGLFEDVPADHWAADYIKEMKDLGIVGGKTATTFEPDATITRAEFVKMIATAFGLEATATDSAFADCGADDWYTPYVVAAAEAGYVNGISETAFGANDEISRQDICTILGRILGLDAADAEATFADIDDIADYALNAVKALADAGILGGYEDGTFAPAKSATRAEVCKILSNILATFTEEAPEADDEAVVEDVVEEDAAEEEAVVEDEAAVEEEAAEEEATEEEADAE